MVILVDIVKTLQKNIICMNKKLNIIAGPCSAESLDQCLSTAKQLSESGISIFRAGVWKPRTKPGGFEGIGEPALNWLRIVRNKTGMKVGCEVANKEQVSLALMYNLDYIWIGARTVTDPFAVQEISDEISRIMKSRTGRMMKEYFNNFTILVKNPVCPDYDLWIGAIERIKNCGVKNIGAIFRGFKTYSKSKYRNEPIWDIPLRLIVEHPEIPIYCDPSHISGNREYIQEICDEAIEYGFNGLMIESHCEPDEAWTDASQQLAPSDLKDLIARIPSSSSSIISNDGKQKLQKYRKEINSIDKNLIHDIIRRMVYAIEIGKIKASQGMEVYQKDRWSKVLKNIFNEASQYTIYSENKEQFDYLIEEIWNSIHSTSCKLQIKNNK